MTRFVGGPLDGMETTFVDDGVSVVRVDIEGLAAPDHEYVKTRPTNTNWRETYDHDWFLHGLSEAPPVPDKVFEWHERGWQSPEVRAIRSAVAEGAVA